MPVRVIFLLALLLSGAVWPAIADDDAADLRDHLASEYPDFPVDSIETTPLDGIYEVVSGADVMYISADGRYMLRGEMLDLVESRNLTADVQSRLRHSRVAELGEDNMVVYEPADGEVNHVVTVFTDTTCGYCRQLHEEMLDAIDEDGIKLRYLMFPRAGVTSAAADTLRAIWCADDPQAAMTAAKRGEDVPAHPEACDPPVASQFEAARAIGVSGTPYLLLGDDGPTFAGYRPREQLLDMLEGSMNTTP